MERQKMDVFMEGSQNKFPAEKLASVKEKPASLPDEKYDERSNLPFKVPTVVLIFSIYRGSSSVDRFIIGDLGLGI